MADFVLKQNDTRPVLDATLTENGTALNLTTATSVKFIMRQQGSLGSAKINTTAAFVNRTSGTVRYTWTSGDTDTIGSFNAEFEVTWSDGGVSTHPSNGYLTIDVQDDLG
jgi:hypothetical protein